ncbi:MAG: glycine--tRNA ligase subunit beta [Bryobacterales bacterium]|nr:glycine--tRNA ligase subunit beta [Bryobacterales bacterium]
MSALPFLLEIGVEEIPDWMIGGALESLRALFQELLTGRNLAEGVTLTLDATPRRLVLRAQGLTERQTDSEELLLGPAKSAAPAAIEGFARKLGVNVDDLGVEKGPKGDRVSYRKKVAGRATTEILAEALPGIILKIYFPKTMFWIAPGGPRFIRPIRWIVALLGDAVVPFELAGVHSGNQTSGHRKLGKARVPVTFETYEQTLLENFVILSADERRKKILAEVEASVKPDPALLETLVYITEYPTVIGGSFDPSYLTLPAEVLVTVMKHHQKYFSVEDKSGALAPRFFAVMNSNGDPDGLVRSGNERVLRARFNDARFFWDADQKATLAARVPSLESVMFQAKLGSYLDKTKRVADLVNELGGDADAVRAAELAKCDLTSELVKEFTELQGVVGGLYARVQGETETAARAIYDQYKPSSMEDSVPRDRAGQILSIADKLDTLRGCFSIGLIPTGSRDPFALRRAGQGIVKILVEAKLSLPIAGIVKENAQLAEFFLDRVRYYFKEIRGFQYDEVNAVLASGWDDLVSVESRLAAVQAVRPTPNFEPLAASFKRIQNILKQADFKGGVSIDPALLEPGAEAELHAEFENVRATVSKKAHGPALEAIASLRPAVDRFFDKVLVNAADPHVRRNRLALLYQLRSEFSTIADFSEIVTTS